MPQIRHGRPPGDRMDRPKPVFVDRTGNRRRITVFAGVGIGAGLLVSLALIITGLFTGSAMPLPSWPDSGQRPGDGAVADIHGNSPAPGTPTTTTTAARTTSRQPIPATSTNPRPTASDLPGQGDQHRATPNGKTSKTPGKPG